MEFLMEEFQQAAVTGSWELEMARERFGPWAEERADFECLVQNPQTSSGLTLGPLRPRPTGLGGDGALLRTLSRWASGAGCRGGLAAENGIGGLAGRLSGQSAGKANWWSCLAT